MPTAAIRDLMMYYEDTGGSGEPLVMIMGLGGDLQAWALTAPALAKQFRVITFDNRGAGRTSSPDRPYTISQMADDTVALMEHLGIASAHVLGFSLGGYVAQELTLKYPARVQKLILLATAAYIEGYNRALVEAWMAARRSNLSREGIARLTACWLYSPEFLDDRERFERAIQNTLNNPHTQQDHAFIRQAQALLGFDARERVKNIKQETLVVAGQDDNLLPPRNSERLAKLLPKATLKVLPGGHVGALEYAAEYNEVFLQFLGAAVPA
jgi:pimeloyl-ACP methyl ester carboxylesterase